MKISENKYYTTEEYFSIVEDSEEKYEYHEGKLYAMAGGTSKHNAISTNTSTALNIALSEKDCMVYNSDQQVVINDSKRYVYPDVSVVCGTQDFEDKKETRLKNPILIIEVLSESTKGFDKTDKFHLYCQIPSFREYVLIHTDKIMVETYYKEDSGLWRISSAFRIKDSIQLYSINSTITLTDIYKKIKNLKEGI